MTPASRPTSPEAKIQTPEQPTIPSIRPSTQPNSQPTGHTADAAAQAVIAMRRFAPQADPERHLPDVHPASIPRHIAIIMDGNGRWAQSKGLPRIAGHKAGAKTVKEIVSACGDIGVEVLTLYSFSVENWRRPKDEIDALMELCVAYCQSERDSLIKEGIRIRVVGDREGLPPHVRDALGALEEATSSLTGPTLALAINYGGRSELVHAARELARDVQAGLLTPEQVNEQTLQDRLYTRGLPDPDLLIRTAGEMRVSNFLLWQISYAEIHVTRTLWPDFGTTDLHAAVRDYACRQRRFGGLPNTAPERPTPC